MPRGLGGFLWHWWGCRCFPWLPRWWWTGMYGPISPYISYTEYSSPYTISKEQEKQILENEIKILEQQLENVKKRTEELKE